MRLLIENKFFRYSTLSSFFNQFGTSIYNIVFVVYIANIYQSKVLVSVANIIMVVPLFFQLWVGQKADEIRDKRGWLIRIGLIQTAFFLIIAYLTKEVTYLSFSFICLFNIVSDCLGQLHSGILMPIFKRNIPSEKLMEAYSFRNALSYVCSFGGQALGVWMLSTLNNDFFLIAWINAVSFLISTLVLVLVKDLLYSSTYKPMETGFWEKIVMMYKTSEQLFWEDSNNNFLKTISAIIITNVLGSAIIPVYSVYFLEQKFLNLSYSQSLFILQSIVILGNILGSLRPKDYFSKLPLSTLIKLQICGYTIIAFLALFETNLSIILTILAFNCYLVGKFNPKFNSLLMKNTPEEQLAQVASFISLIVTLSIPIGTGVFSFLASYRLSYVWCSYILLAFCALCLVMSTSKVE